MLNEKDLIALLFYLPDAISYNKERIKEETKVNDEHSEYYIEDAKKGILEIKKLINTIRLENTKEEIIHEKD